MIEDRYVVVDGRRVHCRVAGAGSHTVVFEAGFGGLSWEWARIQQGLLEEAVTVAYDRPGTGQSDRFADEISGARLAENLWATLDALGVTGKVVLVGHSLGGHFVRLCAADRSDRVLGVLLL